MVDPWPKATNKSVIGDGPYKNEVEVRAKKLYASSVFYVPMLSADSSWHCLWESFIRITLSQNEKCFFFVILWVPGGQYVNKFIIL